RGSGTFTTPILGSIVQNGKFALCAFAFDKQLKSVDFPTFGNPTIPAFIFVFFADELLLFRFKSLQIYSLFRRGKMALHKCRTNYITLLFNCVRRVKAASVTLLTHQ